MIAVAGAVLFASSAAAEPQWLVEVFARQTPEVLYFVDTPEPVVALTIDDGPDSGSTPRILEVLREHDARATFFLISDHVHENEALVHEILQDGHEIANHLTRDEPSTALSPIAFETEFLEADSVLSAFAPQRWFRPGGGWFNDAMLRTVERHGYRLALGSVYPFDPQIPSSVFASRYILRGVEPGSIIVLHDGGERGARTAATLDHVLPELARRGYRVGTLSDLVHSTDPEAP